MSTSRTLLGIALGVAIAGCALTLGVGTAKAATTTFEFSGFVVCGGPCTLDGDIVINTTSGEVVSADFAFTRPFPVTNVALNFVSFVGHPFIDVGVLGTSITIVDPLDAPNHRLIFVLPVSDLIGYAGGQFCQLGGPCPDSAGGIRIGVAPNFMPVIGSLTPVPVPVPAALPLFGSALAAMGIFRWWRRRKLVAA